MNIRLSPKHGVNPCIPKCFVCGEDKNEILLMGRLKGDMEAPKGMVFDQSPCEQCKEYMKQGIILISVDEEKTDDPQNPWRTGGWAVIKQSAVERMPLDDRFKRSALKKRVAFLADKIWDSFGLPR